jgi:hypothetical protein
MDIMWLEDFIKLADEGNFSRAAEARNLTQPAFSRRIRALEEWVGATLVDRDTIRFSRGMFTRSDRALGRFLDYLQKYPRAHPGRDYIR